MQALACCTVAVLRRERFVSAQLILDLAAMALALPFDVEFFIVFVDFVRSPVLPLVLLTVCG